MDREKVIKEAERIMCSTVSRDMIDSFCEDVIALLKEQEDLGKELENAIELIHKKNARIEILNTVLNKQPQIVRCKDCKWFHHNSTCYNENVRFGCYRKHDWYCAEGERRTDDG